MSRREFRGEDPIAVEILNELCKLLDQYALQDQTIEGVLYVGRKQARALNTIVFDDPAIDRNVQTGETRLFGLLVVEVPEEDFAGVHPTHILKEVMRE